MRDRYVAEAAAGDAAKIEALLLTPSVGDPFGWNSGSPVLFLTTARFREGVYRLNSVLVDYAALLTQLASPDLVSPDLFEQLAKDLNGNLRNAVQTFGLSPSPNQEIAIFSTLATAAFRTYLQNRQRSSLLHALQANQPAIEHTADLGAQAVRLTAVALQNEYHHASATLATTLATPPALSEVERRGKVRELIALDDRFIREIAVLRVLHRSYETLPSGHRQLAMGIADPNAGLPMVRELFENGRDLYRMYEGLRQDDKKKETPVAGS